VVVAVAGAGSADDSLFVVISFSASVNRKLKRESTRDWSNREPLAKRGSRLEQNA
jgi:hypothetical protein